MSGCESAAATGTCRFALGLDFGTESARAILVDVATGGEAAQAVFRYPAGVIDRELPETGAPLERDWALQDPADYLEALRRIVPTVLRSAGVGGAQVIGIGVDFTACTILPTRADGTPLSFLGGFRARPHAWTKLWKHHAAQPYADRLNDLARREEQDFLKYYGGKVSSEWAFPKALQIFAEDTEVFVAADRLIEAGDWLVWQLTGVEVRNACAAGYKGLWNSDTGYPDAGFLDRLAPGFAQALAKLSGRVVAPGVRVGGLTPKWAVELGLLEGTAVSAAGIDAHVGVPGSGVASPDELVMIMGTSTCQMVMTRQPHIFSGYAGLVKDGIVEGFYGYEYGQSAVGDIFAWFVENAVPAAYEREAAAAGVDLHTLLSRKAAGVGPGARGLMALDWFNGNRSPLMNASLSGALLGLTLQSRPEDIYRALIEATAYGSRKIIEVHEADAGPLKTIRACGGLTRNPFLMQVYADVLGKAIEVPASSQTVALGSAILGALAAGPAGGGYATIDEAVAHMGSHPAAVYSPGEGPDGREAPATYDRLYAAYQRLFAEYGEENPAFMGALRG